MKRGQQKFGFKPVTNVNSKNLVPLETGRKTDLRMISASRKGNGCLYTTHIHHYLGVVACREKEYSSLEILRQTVVFAVDTHTSAGFWHSGW